MTSTVVGHAPKVDTTSVGVGTDYFTPRRHHTETDTIIRNVDATLSEIERVLNRLSTTTRVDNETDRNLGLLLRLTTAWLEGLSSEEIARILGWQLPSLQKALHGERRVQASQSTRLLLVSEIALHIGRVLERPAVGDWFRTSIPALRGLTPMEAIRRDRGNEVKEVVASYLEPVFG